MNTEDVIRITERYEQRKKDQKSRAKSIVSKMNTEILNNRQLETLEKIIETGVNHFGDRMDIKRYKFELSKYGQAHVVVVFGLKNDENNGLCLLRKHTYFAIGIRGGISTYNNNGTRIKGSKAYRVGLNS